MSEQQDNQQTADIEQVNDELTRGLKLCHSLLNDYRSKLRVRINVVGEAGPANDDETVGNGESHLA